MAITVERKGDFIQTFTGRLFWPLDPRAEEVDIVDIAHALSNICRFCGHTRVFYSVAQHSVFVSRIVPRELALAGLLHDAAEAYISDVTRPVKPYLPNYKEIEAGIYAVIARKYGIPERIPADVKYADSVALAMEIRDFMVADPGGQRVGFCELDEEILPLPPAKANFAFLKRWAELV